MKQIKIMVAGETVTLEPSADYYSQLDCINLRRETYVKIEKLMRNIPQTYHGYRQGREETSLSVDGTTFTLTHEGDLWLLTVTGKGQGENTVKIEKVEIPY